ADLQRADSLRVGFHRVVDRVGGVVGVRHEDPVEEALEPRRVGVAVLAVVMGVVMTVRILVILAVIMIRVIMRGRSALLLVLSVRMGVAVLGHSSARSSW